MGQQIHRRSLLKCVGSGVVLALASSASGEQETAVDESANEDIDEGGELNLTYDEIRSLDPIQVSLSGISQINQVYEGLTQYPNGETHIKNQLLEKVELSDDFKTYTFQIKEGIEYHDNPVKDELTVHDFKYSIRRIAESPESNRQQYVLDNQFLGIVHQFKNGELVPDSLAINIVDDYTFEITLSQPTPNALDILTFHAFSVMPAGLVGDIDGYDGEYTVEELSNEVMVGTGPFELEKWEKESEVRMTAFEDYHGEGPHVDSVHWRLLTSSQDRWEYAMNENADIFSPPQAGYDPDLISSEPDERGRDVGQYGPVDNGAVLTYTGVTTLVTFYAGFNAEKVPHPVRQAIAHVMDYGSLFDEPRFRKDTEALTFLPPSIWPEGYDGYQSHLEDYPYGRNESQTDKAAELLENAGYTFDEPFELTFSTQQGSNFTTVGDFLQDKLSDLPIDFTHEEINFADLIERGINGNLEAFGLGWLWEWDDPLYGTDRLEPASTDTDTNGGFYLNWNVEDSENMKKAQQAWDRIENNPGPADQDIRTEALIEIEEARRDDMVMLPLWHTYQERVRYRWIQGPRPGAIGWEKQQFNTHWIDEDILQGPPPVVGNSPPRDLNGDGLYEDIDGDGELSIGDVQQFFQNRNADVVQNNAEFFNFSDADTEAVSDTVTDEDVTIGDVQALFQLFQEQG